MVQSIWNGQDAPFRGSSFLDRCRQSILLLFATLALITACIVVYYSWSLLSSLYSLVTTSAGLVTTSAGLTISSFNDFMEMYDFLFQELVVGSDCLSSQEWSRAVQSRRQLIADNEGPGYSAMFVGSRGVGKTTLIESILKYSNTEYQYSSSPEEGGGTNDPAVQLGTRKHNDPVILVDTPGFSRSGVICHANCFTQEAAYENAMKCAHRSMVVYYVAGVDGNQGQRATERVKKKIMSPFTNSIEGCESFDSDSLNNLIADVDLIVEELSKAIKRDRRDLITSGKVRIVVSKMSNAMAQPIKTCVTNLLVNNQLAFGLHGGISVDVFGRMADEQTIGKETDVLLGHIQTHGKAQVSKQILQKVLKQGYKVFVNGVPSSEGDVASVCQKMEDLNVTKNFQACSQTIQADAEKPQLSPFEHDTCKARNTRLASIGIKVLITMTILLFLVMLFSGHPANSTPDDPGSPKVRAEGESDDPAVGAEGESDEGESDEGESDEGESFEAFQNL